MFWNYFKAALRNLQKNIVHASLNVFGLAMGIACCITVFVFVDTFSNMDDFHKNGDTIFAVNSVRMIGNREENWGLSKGPIGPALKNDFAEVSDFVRIDDNGGIVKKGDLVFSENIRFVDPNFFTVFDFPLAKGSVTDLQNKNSIFLSEKAALKYFGEENPIGQTLTIVFNQDKRLEFTVKGVAQKFPRNTSFAFDLLVSYDHVQDVFPNTDRWSYNVSATFIRLNNKEAAPKIEKELSRYIPIHNESNINQPVARFYFENLRTLSKNSYQVRGDISGGTDPHGIIALTAIAALVMLMACFNYMNIMLSSAAKRFKEIGIRKVIGGSRGQLIGQFLTENILVSSVALAFGIVLAETVTIPFFNSLIQGNGDLRLEITSDLNVLLFLSVLTGGIAVISGLYPSLYMSAFQPVTILKDVQKIRGNRLLGRVLLVLQFAISLFAIIAGVVFTQNAEFVKNLDLGYESDKIVMLYFDDNKIYRRFENLIASDQRILGIAGSRHHVGRQVMTNVSYENNATSSQANVFRVGANYIPTMELRIAQGHSFDPKLNALSDESAIVNSVLVKSQGWSQPIGQRIRLEGKDLTVIGVLEDFYYRSYHRTIDPCIMTVIPEDQYKFMAIKIAPEDLTSIKPFLQKTWREVNPDQPFELLYQDEVFLDDVTEDEMIKNIFLSVAVMTLLIAAMGLFALVSLTIVRRTKEIGIRKVLGASITHIMHLVNRDFYWLIGIASVIIFPVAFFLLNNLLDDIYATHVEISFLPFGLSVLIFALVAILTIGSRVFSVARENPVEALKYE